MNTPEDYILEAIEIVSAWDLPDDDLADAANAQPTLCPDAALTIITRATRTENPSTLHR